MGNKKMENGSNGYVDMIEICGQHFYLDVEELDKFLLISDGGDIVENVSVTEHYDEEGKLTGKIVNKDKHENGRQYDNVKFEMVRYLLDALTLETGDIDPKLGINTALSVLPLPSKIAFNTLAGYGILKKY